MKKQMSLPVAVTILVAVFAVTLWGRYDAIKKGTLPQVVDTSISSFAECRDAGNPIMESYPELCTTPDGKHFTNPDQVVESLPENNERVAAGYIAGSVTLGPVCPVEQEGVPCEPTPEMFTSREVLVYEIDRVTIRERVFLSPEGKYHIAIGPGNYFVQIAPAGIGPGEMKEVAVVSFETRTVDFDIDTGIR